MMYDTNNSFDVGGLPHSVVGGLIGAAVGTLAPTGGISTIVGTVVGALSGMFLGGVFPIDYKITVMLYKRLRILEPAMPTVIEYYERTAVYGGPSTDLYEDELYYNTRILGIIGLQTFICGRQMQHEKWKSHESISCCFYCDFGSSSDDNT